MKLSADQQAPLDALTARESELSAPELAELNFLRNLATSEETPSDEPAADDEVTEPSIPLPSLTKRPSLMRLAP